MSCKCYACGQDKPAATPALVIKSLRCTDAEAEQWDKARGSKTFTQWVRECLNAHAAHEIGLLEETLDRR